MRYSIPLTAFLILLATACEAGPPPFGQQEKEALAVEVEEALRGLTEAMNAHDPERVMSHFRNSEEFVYLGCTDFLLSWNTFSTIVSPYYVASQEVTFEQEVVRIQVLSPTVAVAALRGRSSEADALFWTEVLVKEDGRWLIAHEHESWPGCSESREPHPFTSGAEMPGMVPVGEEGAAADTVS